MTSHPPRLDTALARESLAVVALTVVGAAIRLWSLARLGLVHFDEGIYAQAGFWIFSPRGLAGIDPSVISYAPPGFPALVGLSYLVLGVGDGPAILVSVACGTLTIPVVGWLARRTFGPGAGGAAAAFAALSGPHVAFSRMALTDTSFLLVWLVAIGQGQRFLERPKPARSRAVGAGRRSCGAIFKYHGWIAGLIVALTAALWLFVRPDLWRRTTIIATWGWGLVAAIFAAIVYWPWFRFVESHGGYSALLAHQRRYLGDLWSWPDHLSQQIDQARLLSGGPVWLICGGLAAVCGMLYIVGNLAGGRRELPRLFVEAIGLTALWLLPGWVVFALWICFLGVRRLKEATIAQGVLGVGWTLLLILTPFYRPYARLWLPVQALNWLFMAATLAWIRTQIEVAGTSTRWSRRDPLLWFAASCVLAAGLQALSPDSPWKITYPGLLQPSDSVRQACHSIVSAQPDDVHLHVLARPPFIYYFALIGRPTNDREPDLARLADKGNAKTWAILDMALTRQDHVPEQDVKRALAGWIVFREIPTTLNPPTLLDIDPGAARGGTLDLTAPVRLLRPGPPKEVQ